MHKAFSELLLLVLLIASATATKVKFDAKLSKTKVNPGDKFALTVILPKHSPCLKAPAKCKKHPNYAGCPVSNSICTLQLHVPDGAAYLNNTKGLKADVNGQADFSSIVTMHLPVTSRVLGKSKPVLTHQITFIADSCVPASKLPFSVVIKNGVARNKAATKKALQVRK